jgi:hypothetical protein
VLDRLAEKVPNVYQLMVDFNQANPKASFLEDDEKISLPEKD